MTRELVDALVTLPLRERLTMRLVPSALYYRRRLADEAEWGEHELDVLGEIMAPGGTAVDVGANQGFFAYAFSGIAARVEAFEPNPDYAAFARAMLGSRARVHAVALSNRSGTAEFVVPVSEQGMALHLGGSLNAATAEQGAAQRFQVEVRTLDSYGLRDVRTIKVDVEGSEREVLEGGRETILRDRPALIVEPADGRPRRPGRRGGGDLRHLRLCRLARHQGPPADRGASRDPGIGEQHHLGLADPQPQRPVPAAAIATPAQSNPLGNLPGAFLSLMKGAALKRV